MKRYIFFLFSIGRAVQFNLVTTFWDENDASRRQELVACISNNIQNRHIKKVYIFDETKAGQKDKVLLDKKIELVPISGRPSFQSMVDFANQFLDNQMVIICNTDIYFDDSLGLINQNIFYHRDTVFALTRYNVPEYKGSWKRHKASYDSWIFKTPLNIQVDEEIKMGTPTIEYYLLRSFRLSGIRVFNPSLSIRSWHLHLDDSRNYDNECEIAKRRPKEYEPPFIHIKQVRQR